MCVCVCVREREREQGYSSLFVSGSIFPYSTNQLRRPTDRLGAAKVSMFFCKTASLQSYRICVKVASTTVSHFACLR